MSRFWKNVDGYLMVADGSEDTHIECLTDDDWVEAIKREWNLTRILAAVLQEPITQLGDSEAWGRALYLGELINPSGKYYLPFAASNVAEDCPLCNGVGELKNPLDLTMLPDLAERVHAASELRHSILPTGMFFTDLPEDKRQVVKLCTLVESLIKPTIQCPRCGGHGSASARDDEDWREAFEKILSDMSERLPKPHEGDLQLEQGLNGDGCSFYVVQYTSPPFEPDDDVLWEDPNGEMHKMTVVCCYESSVQLCNRDDSDHSVTIDVPLHEVKKDV